MKAGRSCTSVEPDLSKERVHALGAETSRRSHTSLWIFSPKIFAIKRALTKLHTELVTVCRHILRREETGGGTRDGGRRRIIMGKRRRGDEFEHMERNDRRASAS